MKYSAEPCINNYLTVHVPASNFNYQKKGSKHRINSHFVTSPQINPLMNAKILELKKKKSKQQIDDKIQIKYNSQKKAVSKKKKMYQIPLLSNLKQNLHATESANKLKIIKYQQPNKNTYNLIFTKKQIWGNQPKTQNQTLKQFSESSNRRNSMTQSSTRALFRVNNMNQSKIRKSDQIPLMMESASNLINEYQKTELMRHNTQMKYRINSQPRLRVSGSGVNDEGRQTNFTYNETFRNNQFKLRYQGQVYCIE